MSTSSKGQSIVRDQLDEGVKSARSKRIRQDRLELSKDESYVLIGERKYELLNCSVFGLAVCGDVPLRMEIGQITRGQVKVEAIDVGSYDLRLVREEAVVDGKMKYAFEVIGTPLNVFAVNGIREAQNAFSHFNSEEVEALEIPIGFRHRVLDFKEMLTNLENTINELEKKFVTSSLDEKSKIESGIIAYFVRNYCQRAETSINAMASELERCASPTVKRAHEYFRNQLGKFMYKSKGLSWAFSKPLGYAGDYEMMNILYRNEDYGDTLFSKCMHRLSTGTAAPRAVRSRAEYLSEKLVRLITSPVKKSVKILSVASGPAREVQNVLQSNEVVERLPDVEFSFLDQDLVSLKSVQRFLRSFSLEKGIEVKHRLVHQTIKRVIAGGLEDSGFDLIYSAGLFDYFTDPVAQLAGMKLYDALAPGGQLIIGNFDTNHPTQAFMELAMDWFLIYRSEEDLLRIFNGLGSENKIEREKEGVNLFIVITKPN